MGLGVERLAKGASRAKAEEFGRLAVVLVEKQALAVVAEHLYQAACRRRVKTDPISPCGF